MKTLCLTVTNEASIVNIFITVFNKVNYTDDSTPLLIQKRFSSNLFTFFSVRELKRLQGKDFKEPLCSCHYKRKLSQVLLYRHSVFHYHSKHFFITKNLALAYIPSPIFRYLLYSREHSKNNLIFFHI